MPLATLALLSFLCRRRSLFLSLCPLFPPQISLNFSEPGDTPPWPGIAALGTVAVVDVGLGSLRGWRRGSSLDVFVSSSGTGRHQERGAVGIFPGDVPVCSTSAATSSRGHPLRAGPPRALGEHPRPSGLYLLPFPCSAPRLRAVLHRRLRRFLPGDHRPLQPRVSSVRQSTPRRNPFNGPRSPLLSHPRSQPSGLAVRAPARGPSSIPPRPKRPTLLALLLPRRGPTGQ